MADILRVIFLHSPVDNANNAPQPPHTRPPFTLSLSLSLSLSLTACPHLSAAHPCNFLLLLDFICLSDLHFTISFILTPYFFSFYQSLCDVFVFSYYHFFLFLSHRVLLSIFLSLSLTFFSYFYFFSMWPFISL